jgi:hypothetical protein
MSIFGKITKCAAKWSCINMCSGVLQSMNWSCELPGIFENYSHTSKKAKFHPMLYVKQKCWRTHAVKKTHPTAPKFAIYGRLPNWTNKCIFKIAMDADWLADQTAKLVRPKEQMMMNSMETPPKMEISKQI